MVLQKHFFKLKKLWEYHKIWKENPPTNGTCNYVVDIFQIQQLNYFLLEVKAITKIAKKLDCWVCQELELNWNRKWVRFVKNAHNICPYLHNHKQKKMNKVHNLITFSIVFTNKIGGGALWASPPIITKVYLPPIITKVNSA